MRVIGLLTAYFPHMTLPEPTVLLWADEIRGYDYGAALEAVKRIGRDSAKPPSLAELLSLVRAESIAARRREFERQAAERGLAAVPDRPWDPEEQQEINERGVARVRELLSRIGRDMPEANDG